MKVSQIKETCLYIKDLEKSRQFYHDVLGLPIISQVHNRHIFFRAGTSVLLCFNPEVTKKEKTLPPHFAYGHQHIAFEVSSEYYDQYMAKLKSQNIEILHHQEWKNELKSFYFADPDGHIVEILMEGIWD